MAEKRPVDLFLDSLLKPGLVMPVDAVYALGSRQGFDGKEIRAGLEQVVKRWHVERMIKDE